MLLFHGTKPKSDGRKSNASAPGDINKDRALADAARAPRVSQMRRFSSGRDALGDVTSISTYMGDMPVWDSTIFR